MWDPMNELVQFSPLGGQLSLEIVPGDTNGRKEAENDSAAAAGAERTMYVYAPKSGCPAAKQCQVLMLLRNSSDEASARAALEQTGLAELAEERHFILVLPNPMAEGWNYDRNGAREDDMAYLVRCFAALRGSRTKVTGFNGMTFYAAMDEASSAMLCTMAACRPLNAPAIFTGALPAGYCIPDDALNVPVAAWSGDDLLTDYLKAANAAEAAPSETGEGYELYRGTENPNIRLLVSTRPADRETLRLCWEKLFSETRRWQNDTYGTYQARTNFTERGFTAHVKDRSLGVNNGYAHTWYEYVPPRLRGRKEPAPLVFYFHGGGCVPLYGAEQSGWHDIADREGFIVVYPEASFGAKWNVWNDPSVPDDDAFIMALLARLERTYAIDRSRIYISGFSMGGMMTNAMAALHPDVFAAAAPCNAYHDGYFSTMAAMDRRMKAMAGGFDMDVLRDRSFDEGQPPSETRLRADRMKAEKDYRIPLFQVSGLKDMTWPLADSADGRLLTFNYWLDYNHVPADRPLMGVGYESGLLGHENGYLGNDERFLHHRWRDKDGTPVYELLLTKRMPHALDLRAMEYAWAFFRQFSRGENGDLNS